MGAVNHSRRFALRRGFAALAAALSVRSSRASKPEKQRLHVAAGSAPVALAQFIRQTGLQVLFDFDAVCNFSTREVSGQLDAEEALSRMLEGSGLTFEFINERTVAVRPLAAAVVPARTRFSEREVR